MCEGEGEIERVLLSFSLSLSLVHESFLSATVVCVCSYRLPEHSFSTTFC